MIEIIVEEVDFICPLTVGDVAARIIPIAEAQPRALPARIRARAYTTVWAMLTSSGLRDNGIRRESLKRFTLEASLILGPRWGLGRKE